MYPLSKLAQSFITRSISYQKNKQIKSLVLPLIISLIGITMGSYLIFKEVQLNTDKQLIQECEGKEICHGITKALERLVKAKRSLKFYNLSGANLSGANLIYSSLYGVNLSGANLSGANLSGASLYGANLSGANLSGANLIYASLYGVNLYGANLSDAYLERSNLKYANFKNAKLYGASLYDAKLEYANLKYANLTEVYFTSSLIKLTCYWEKAVYRDNWWDKEKNKWVFDEKANQQYIEKLKRYKDSERKEPVDCRRWE